MSWALVYLGTLAFAAFIFRETRRSAHDALEERLKQVETALASPQDLPAGWDEKRVKKLEDTVSILALSAGLKAKLGPQDAPQG